MAHTQPIHAVAAVRDAPCLRPERVGLRGSDAAISLFEELLRETLEREASAQPYVVQSGDTLSGVCRTVLERKGEDASPEAVATAVRAAVDANTLGNPDHIVPGQRLDLSGLVPSRKSFDPAVLEAFRSAIGTYAWVDSVSDGGMSGEEGVVSPGKELSCGPFSADFGSILGGRFRVSSGFGVRKDPVTGRTKWHDGVDLAARSGTPVRAAGGGTVTFSGWKGGYGRVVIVDHGGKCETVYAHNATNLVKSGDRVAAGTLLANVGSSGRATGPHLHFEIRRNGRAVDPSKGMDAIDERIMARATGDSGERSAKGLLEVAQAF